MLEEEKHTFGLLVDGVTEIIELQQGAIQPTPEIATGFGPSHVSGVVALDQRMISLIGIDGIIPQNGLAVA